MSDRPLASHPLAQLTLMRLREFVREPEAVFWVVIFPIVAAAAPETVTGPADVLPGGDRPGGAGDGMPAQAAVRAPERSWSLRTGLRKGIADQMLDEEIAAAPDVAVLKSGFYPAWTGLLAEFRESAVIAEPDRIAGLAGIAGH